MPQESDGEVELEHVLRPVPPWRETGKTECGLDMTKYKVISRDQFIAKVQKQGKQRSAMTTCMTCWNTASRHMDWESNPAHVISRDVNVWGDEKQSLINKELRAIAALIQAHREEFEGYLEGLDQTASLELARRRARMREARARRGLPPQ